MVILGSKVKDNITKFTGVAVSRTVYLHGCVHITVQPATLDKDGKPSPEDWFDEQRVEVLRGTPLRGVDHDVLDFELGNEVKDKMTGFKGIVTSITHHLYDTAIHVGISPTELKDGEIPKGAVLAHNRVELVTPRPVVVSKDSSAKSGGPTDRAPRRSGPPN